MLHAALMTYSLTKGIQLLSCSLCLVHSGQAILQKEGMREIPEEERETEQEGEG